MKASTKRLILRIVHLVSIIPVLGYVYQPIAEAGQYQQFTQFVFIPLAMLTGYWMYMGFAYAIIGVAAWLGLNYAVGGNNGFGYALLVQVVLFIVRLVLKRTRRTSVVPTAA